MSYEILTENYFCVPHKIGENRVSILNYYFSKYIYALANQTYLLHVENKSNCYNQYSVGLNFSWNLKKCHTDQVYYKFFTLSEKERLPNLQK